MAQPPLTFLERKWANGSGHNLLVKGATQTNHRETVPMLDYDSHRSVTSYGRRTLMSLGRFLYMNCSPVRGAVDEIARLSVASFIPQFYGADKKWGREAEEFLYESDTFIDVRGWQHTMESYLHNLVREAIVDGDRGTLLTEIDGSAKIQAWRAHRIGSRQTVGIVEGGPYDGAAIIDGVVVNDLGRPIAYALVHDSRHTEPFAYVSANDFLLSYLPTASDTVRQLSMLGASVFDWQDANDFKAYTLLHQKIIGTFGAVVHNETGMVDRTKGLVRGPATEPSDGERQSLPQEIAKPGRNMYLRAGKGEKIEVIENKNPSTNAMAFQEEVIRESLHGMGWSFDFSHNPSKVGGAPFRVVVAKINARLNEIRCLLVKPFMRRVTGWRIAKAIKSGLLRENDEWFKWEFQGPGDITADEKYQSDTSIQEINNGLRSPQRETSKRGLYWEDEQDATIAWHKRFRERCEAEGVDPNTILLRGSNPQSSPESASDDEGDDKAQQKKGGKEDEE